MLEKQSNVPVITLVLTCEHAGNYIPEEYQHLLPSSAWVLQTHRGQDIGIQPVFDALRDLAEPNSFTHVVSRLLVDLNRSLHNPELYSEFTAGLPGAEKERLIATVYTPYRTRVERAIRELLQQPHVIVWHLSLHSFTPVLRRQKRTAQIGILFDERRELENLFALALQRELGRRYPRTTIRFNYPYSGADDGFTTYLRTEFPDRYAGLELELNQRFCKQQREFRRLHDAIAAILAIEANVLL